MKKIGIYIHIPFCEQKCLYCDFTTMPYQDKRIEEYFNLLIKEIELYNEDYFNYEVDTIYIGGGTPTYVNPIFIEKIVHSIFKKFNVRKNIEFTIEANPSSIDEFKIDKYLELGINRISLGVQSFNDKILKKIGRNHSSDDIFKDIEIIKKLGFKNISLDLIMGLPGQTIDDIDFDLKEIGGISPNHISYYDLIIEKNTRFHKLYNDKKIILPDENTNRNFYNKIIHNLSQYGLKQYEISNFAKEGYESKHNLKYWNIEEYISFGLSASGFFNNIRYNNEFRYKSYKNKIENSLKPINIEENLSIHDRIFEQIIMNMRLTKGVDTNLLYNKYNFDIYEKNKKMIKEYIASGLIKELNNFLIFTEEGFNVSNRFFVDLQI